MENLHLPRKSPPLGSHRGQVEALMLGSTLGSQTKRSREMPETTPRESQKRTGTSWRSPESWSSSECGPALLSLGQENREEFRPKSKGEKLLGLFYEVIITLITKPVKNSTYSKIQSTKIPK